MKKIRIGKTDIEVSQICLGSMNFGSREDNNTSYALLNQYCHAGGNFIDTANTYSFWIPGYSGGESELLLGKWMKETGNRNKLIIASKVGMALRNEEYGLSLNQIVTECERSLKRLGIETIDIYYAHLDDRNTPIEETLEAFDRLHKAGKIRHIGASNFMPWRIEESLWISQQNRWVEYCCIQQRYSYVRPNPGGQFTPQLVANDELLNYCYARNITLLAYSPLLNGAYSRADRVFPKQYLGEDTNERANALSIFANEYGITINQLIYAWMIQNTPSIIPIMGVSTSMQMQENLQAINIQLNEDQINKLNEVCTGGTAW